MELTLASGPERISFRLAVLYRCLHGSAPGYLASDLQRVSDLGARRRLRSSTTLALVAPRTVRGSVLPSATESSRWLLHLSGTACRRQYAYRRHCQFSAVDRRLNFLPGLTAALTNEGLTPHCTESSNVTPLLLLHVLVVLGLTPR